MGRAKVSEVEHGLRGGWGGAVIISRCLPASRTKGSKSSMVLRRGGLLLWILLNICVSLSFVLPRVFVLGKVAEVA